MREVDQELFDAVEQGSLGRVQRCLDRGANIHARDSTKAGKKPIHVAAMEGCTHIVELFLSKGVNINDPDKEGRTSLYYAAWKGRLDTVEFLIDEGANIHAGNIHGVKPIHIAATGVHQEIIEFLLNKGASVDNTDKDGWIPLHYAAETGHLEVIRFLLDKGSNINAVDNYGKTPSDLARGEGHMEIVNILDGIEIEVTESKSSSVCSSLKDSQEVQESDEEYFESERDELEAAKKDIIEHLKYRCNCVFIVTGKDRGKNCWHYVLIDSDKKEVFQEQSKTGSMNAADYGKILYSGWGENPPQNIRDKVDEFFNKKVSNDLFVIKEKRENKNVYHYILVDPDKKEMFQERSKTSSALIRKIEDYGRILYSGWGQDPPESIPDRIARAYFCTNERDLEGEFANLSVKDDNALYDAARNGELETVKYLIKKGVNVNTLIKMVGHHCIMLLMEII